MVRVTDVQDEDAPTVLIVDNNAMSTHRLSQIFRQREFQIVICDDGDRAVDEYIRHDPELVILSLDIPTLDGHIAALEMREHGGDGRIIFTAPRRLASTAENAVYSAGAIGWLQKPVSGAMFDDMWDDILGPVPVAPGLADLDALHPGADLPKIEILPDPEALPPPPLPLPAPTPAITPATMQVTAPTPKPSRRWTRWALLLILLIGTGAGVAYQLGLLPAGISP